MANKKKGNNKGINPVVVGMVGVAVGVAAVELSNEKKRKKVQKKLGEFRERGEQAYAELKRTATDVKGKLEELSSLAREKVAENGTEKKIKKSATNKPKR